MAVLHRMALGIAGPDAVERLGISAAQLGSFVTLQLAGYAVMQVPWGLAIDRYGPRRVLLIATTLIGASEIGFAFASSYPAALLARGVLGIGDSAVFIAVLRLVSLWFPRRRYALMTMVTGLFGMAGNLLATVPLALAFDTWGWTRTFVVTGAISLVYALLLLRPAVSAPYREVAPAHAHPSGPTRRARGRASARRLVGQVRSAWQVPEQRLAFWTHQATMASGTAFTALWAFPYLTEGLGMSSAAAAAVLTLFVLGLLGSSLVIGPVTGRRPGSRAPIALGVAVAGVLAWTVLLGWPGGHPPHAVVVGVVMVLAVGGPASQIGFQIARDHAAPGRTATATAITNAGGFLAAMLGCILVGVVLDARTGGLAPTLLDYRWALAVLGAGASCSTVMMARSLLRCRRRALLMVDDGGRPPIVPIAHWWDTGYERIASRRRGSAD